MPRSRISALDRQYSSRYVITSVALASLTIAGADAFAADFLASGSSSSSSSSSGSFNGPSGFGGFDFEEDWCEFIHGVQGKLLLAAEEPFRRGGVTYAPGPEKYSFERIRRQWGDTVNCEATFRFSLPKLRKLLVALRFPPYMYTKSGNVAKGEEALLYLLRRLAYPATLARP